ncbi:MAG: hypothetical protein M1827_003014 [Pycnora praestabilis]|nr:MAG: hypothetical protein M1827_003014 [Pycnora praestabilis]
MEGSSSMGSYFTDAEDYVVDATLLHVVTGDHPIHVVCNTDWQVGEANREARFRGYPARNALMRMKREKLDEVKDGNGGLGPQGKGWGVQWPLLPESLDKERDYEFEDLAHRPSQCQQPSTDDDLNPYDTWGGDN